MQQNLLLMEVVLPEKEPLFYQVGWPAFIQGRMMFKQLMGKNQDRFAHTGQNNLRRVMFSK